MTDARGFDHARMRALLDELGQIAGKTCTHAECRECFYHELRTKGEDIVAAFPAFAQAHARKSVADLVREESNPDREVPCQHVPQPETISPADVERALQRAREVAERTDGSRVAHLAFWLGAAARQARFAGHLMLADHLGELAQSGTLGTMTPHDARIFADQMTGARLMAIDPMLRDALQEAIGILRELAAGERSEVAR